MTIQAVSWEAAIEQAQQETLPDGDYLEGSFEIDGDDLAECNQGLSQAVVDQLKKQYLSA